jgi:zinc protease
MTDAPSGRLHKALVASGKAAAVLGFSAPLHDPGFLLMGAQLTLDQDADAARVLLLSTLERLAADPLTDEEVERARGKWLRDWEQRFTDPEEVGVALSEFVALGDWRTYFQLRDRVRTISTAEVNRVARTYLLAANRTLGQYVPSTSTERAPKPQAVDVQAQLQTFKPVESIKQAAAFDASPSSIDAQTQRITLRPGLTLALLPKETRGDAVVARWTLRWGSLDSMEGQVAALTLLPALLDKGAQGWSRQQIQDRLTQLRAELSFSGGVAGLQVAVKTTREHLPAVISLVSVLLRQPLLDAPSLEEVRRQALAGLQQSRDEPQAVAARALGRHGNPYGAGHPRHVPTVGEWESQLRAVDVSALRRLHARLVGATDAQFAAVGSFDPVAVSKAVEAGLSQWRSEVTPVRLPNPLVPVSPTRMVLQTPDKQNAILAFRLPLAIQELDPDHAPLLVANYIVGGSENSRLWTRVREKEGLSYGLNTQLSFDPFERSSLFSGVAAFAPENRERVERAFREELHRSMQEPFTTEEIQRAIDGLLSARRLIRAQDDWLAGTLVHNTWLGRSMAVSQQLDLAIGQVTADAAAAAWRRHIRPESVVWAVAGDFKDLR